MDASDDFRSQQAREEIVKALDSTLKDRPLLPPRFPSDPRQLEEVIFKSSNGNKEDYMKKINKVLQLAGAGQQQPSMNYEISGGGVPGRRLGSGGGPVMISSHRMLPSGAPDDPSQQQVQHQHAPPNATISSVPLPPQQQQQQHYAVVTGQMDTHGRMLQPPPNPYVQQQQVVGGAQQMNMQPGTGSGNVVAVVSPQQQHMLQQQPHRMVSRLSSPAMRLGQPGPAQGIVIAAEAQRYGNTPQERPGEFMRMQQPRFVRTPMQQGVPHPMQPAAHWAAGGAGSMVTSAGSAAGGQPIAAVHNSNDAVVVTHFGTGTPMRHQIVTMRSDVGSGGSGLFQQQTPQQSYAPRGPAIIAAQQQPPSMATGSPSRFEQPVRMPAAPQQQYSRHAAPLPPVPMMGPPSVPLPAQYAPMSSPNPAPLTGPSPVAAAAPAGSYAQEQSPVYATTSVGSVGHKYTAAAEPSPAIHAPADTTVAEDPGYREKIQELRMYLEPLKRMLEQHQKDGDRSSVQSQKLLKIIDIIEGKSKATLDLLLKCEDTLKKMVHKGNEGGKARESAICQPLFEVVASLVRTSTANQSLKRAFALPPVDIAAAKRLCAPKHPEYASPRTIEANFLLKLAQFGCESTSTPCKRNSSVKSASGATDSTKIPISIQREVASLEPRFRIMLEQGLMEGVTAVSGKVDAYRFVDVVCTLEDHRLPNVPALRLRIPNDYPVSSPKFDCDFLEYCGSPFLESLREMLILRLTKLESKCSITSVLDNWESTVRQACVSQ